MATTELGLIGTGIGQSLAPFLHETLGRLTRRPVRYTLHELAPDRTDALDELLTGLARATAFALVDLEADAIRLHDPDRERAARLADDLSTTTLPVTVHESAEEATEGADAILNRSPVGSHRLPGCRVEHTALVDLRWAFDAVYTPPRTDLVQAAARCGADVVTGVELFFWQGVDAHQVFRQASIDRDSIGVAAKLVSQEIGESHRGGGWPNGLPRA